METAYKTTAIGPDTYLNTKNDSLLRIVRNHKKQKKKYSVISQAEIFRRELNLPDTPQFENEAPTSHARKVKENATRHAQDQIKQRWEEKQMHGQYSKRIGEKNVDHPDDKPMVQNSWAEIRKRSFYHRCPRPGHQNLLLPEQNSQRWHRLNVPDMWSIPGNHRPCCGRMS